MLVLSGLNPHLYSQISPDQQQSPRPVSVKIYPSTCVRTNLLRCPIKTLTFTLMEMLYSCTSLVNKALLDCNLSN